jgi:anthranilate phosphoribosyltransferase
LSRYTITPEQFGLRRADVAALAVDSAAQSLAMLHDVLAGTPGPGHDIVALNAGAAIYAAGLTATLEAGIRRAIDVLAEGQAADRLAQLVALTQQFSAD